MKPFLTETEAAPFTWLEMMYKGVNFSVPGTGGLGCLQFVGAQQQCVETLFASALSLSLIFYASHWVSCPLAPRRRAGTAWSFSSMSHALFLLLLCASFGVEVYCKMRDNAVVWLLNICHLVTALEIVLFACPRAFFTTPLFRILMHSLHGPFAALVFPVVNTRLHSFEVTNYYVQHILITTGPLYLLWKGGAYNIEPYTDFHWPLLACGIIFFIYWVPVQLLCWVTHVNINNMICPAITDPFYGPYYRLWALLHSAAGIIGFGKIYSWVGYTLLGWLVRRPADQAMQINGKKLH